MPKLIQDVGSNQENTAVAVNAGSSGYVLPIASATILGGIRVGQGLTIDPNTGILDSDESTYALPPATNSALGGIIVGNTLTIATNGLLNYNNPNPTPYILPTASTSILGGVKVDGVTVTIANGVISAPPLYILPIASNITLGGIKVGNNLTINSVTGVLDAQNSYVLPAATNAVLGGIIAGNAFTIAANGLLNYTNPNPTPYVLPVASTSVLGGVKVDGSTIVISNANVISAPYTYSLPTATNLVKGGVIVGNNLTVAANGMLDALAPYSLPTASSSVLGGVKVGANLTINGAGAIDYVVPTPYSLPVASSSVLGGIKIGSTLTLNASNQLDYNLPAASTSVLGGVKVDGITILINGTTNQISSIGSGLPNTYVGVGNAANSLSGSSALTFNGVALVSQGSQVALAGASTNYMAINGIAVGVGANARGAGVGESDSIAVGALANAGGGGISLGAHTNTGSVSVAIGEYANAPGFQSVAIGWGANADNEGVALGSNAVAASSSVAIGPYVVANVANTVVLGTNVYTTNIPGQLFVNGVNINGAIASNSMLGLVKVGANITINGTGVIDYSNPNPTPYVLNSAEINTALGFGPLNPILLANANGIATLDGAGKLTSGQIPSSLVGAVVYKGTWNAATNTPPLVSGVGTQGNYYVVSVAGTTSIDGVNNWSAGDWIIFGTSTWSKVDGAASEVFSVFGRTGVVTMTATDVSNALTYTPYNATNPNSYVNAATLPVASASNLGGIKIGSTLTLNASNQLDYINPNPTAYTLPVASTTVLGGVKVDNSTIKINAANVISISVASGSVLGAIMVGPNLTINAGYLDYALPFAGQVHGGNNVLGGVVADGTTITVNGSGAISVASVPLASDTRIGGVKLGADITIDGNGVINYINPNPTPYSLPAASTTVLGGVKVDGTTVVINATTNVISSTGNTLLTNTYVGVGNSLGVLYGSADFTYTEANLYINTVNIAIGNGATANNSGIAIGNGASAISGVYYENSIAIGNGANAANGSIAIGFGWQYYGGIYAIGVNSVAIGGSTSYSNHAIAILGNVFSSDNAGSSIAIGFGSIVAGNKSIALGYGANVEATDSIAIGYGVTVNVNNTIQFGLSTTNVVIPGTLFVNGVNINGRGGGSYTLPAATTSVLGGVIVGNNLTVAANGMLDAGAPYSLPVASSSALGGIKIGSTLTLNASNQIDYNNPNPTPYALPAASTTVLGGVKVDGTTITINATTNVISGASTYSLPAASTTVLGGVIVGNNLTVAANGMLDALAPYSLPTASSSVLGGIKVGSTLTLNASNQLDYINPNPTPYALPVASTMVLGGVKVDGTTITINATTNTISAVATPPTLGQYQVGVGNAGTVLNGTANFTFQASQLYVNAANIGLGAVTLTGATNGIAIGNGASVSAVNAVAIGAGAASSTAEMITLGIAASRVNVPGTLYVAGVAPLYSVPIATTSVLGGVMPDGTTITVAANGKIAAATQTPALTTGQVGYGIAGVLGGSADHTFSQSLFYANSVAIALGKSSAASNAANSIGIGSGTVVGAALANTNAVDAIVIGTGAGAATVANSWANTTIVIGKGAIAGNVNGAQVTNSIVIGTAAFVNGIGIGGLNSIVVGAGAYTNSRDNVVIGTYGSYAIGFNGVVIGAAANATATNGYVVIGNGARAAGPQSVAIGANTSGNGIFAIAIGSGASASGLSLVIGAAAAATGTNSVVIGYGASAGSGASAFGNSVSIGANTNAAAERAIAIGKYAFAKAGSVCIGNGAQDDYNESVVLGDSASGNGQQCVAIGYVATCSGNGYSVAIGAVARAQSYSSVAIGNGAQTSLSNGALNGIAIGTSALANNAVNGIAIGAGTIVNAVNAVAIGVGAISSTAEMITLGVAAARVNVPGTLYVAGVNINGLNATSSTPGLVQPDNSTITVVGGVISSSGAPNTCQSYGGVGVSTISVNSMASIMYGRTWANTTVGPQYAGNTKSVQMQAFGSWNAALNSDSWNSSFNFQFWLGNEYMGFLVTPQFTAANVQSWELEWYGSPTPGTSGASQTYTYSALLKSIDGQNAYRAETILGSAQFTSGAVTWNAGAFDLRMNTCYANGVALALGLNASVQNIIIQQF